MSQFYVTDLRDYAPPGAPVHLSAAARRLRDYLGAVVEAASVAPADMVVLTVIRCRRRPKRRACPGRLHATRDRATSEIHWRCRACGEGGVIYNWRGTAWDRSGAAPPAEPGRHEQDAEVAGASVTGDGESAAVAITPGRAFGERLLQEALARLGREPESLEELQSVIDSVTGEYNRTPQEDLGGLAPIQAHRLLAADWTAPGCALQLDERLPPEALAGVRELTNARIFLRALGDAGGTRATWAGNLNRRFVAEMVQAMAWPPGFRDALYRYTKVVNELDAFPLHLVRVLLVLAGLVRLRKGSFGLTRRGAALLAESRAGELYAHLFRTQFRKMNLAYFDRGPEAPGLQNTVAYSLYRLARVGGRWSKPERLSAEVILPAVLAEIPPLSYVDSPALILETRVLRPLERFGLAESREVPGKYAAVPDHEYRKTPLYDRFLRFDLSAI